MLIEFKFENFRSFRDEQVLSFTTGGHDKTHRENLVTTERGDILKCATVFGSNASGKSNLLKAMRAMRGYILRSATSMSVGDPIHEAKQPIPAAVDGEG